MTWNSERRGGPLVVGGRGFIGAHVVRALVRRGRRPLLFGPVMDMDMAGDDRLADLAGRFDEVVGSIEDGAALGAALATSGATQVISTAAFSAGRGGLLRSGERHGSRALAVNVGGLNTLIDAARAAGVRRLAWTSSTTVYGAADQYPAGAVAEDAAPRPRSFYGLTKTLAEQLARYHHERGGISVVGLRLPLVLGRGLWYQGAAAALAELFAAAAPGAVHAARFAPQAMDLIDVRDVARALVAVLDYAADAPLQPVYNVNGFTATAAQLARAAERAVPGYRVDFSPAETTSPLPLIDDARFRRAVGFAPAFDLDALAAALTATSPDEELL